MDDMGPNQTAKTGLPPGTPILVGKRRAEDVRISLMAYDEDHLREDQGHELEGVLGEETPGAVTWINVDGLHRMDVIEELGRRYGLHPLVLEDVVNTGQRPKVDTYPDRLFVVLKMFQRPGPDQDVDPEQVSLVLGPDFVLSFQERQGDVFDPVRERIRTARGQLRSRGADYLFYALMDAVVDGYFGVCEEFGERMQALEDECLENPGPQTSRRIHHLKRQQILLRKSLWPLREVLNVMLRDRSPLLTETTLVYLRDVYDHTILVVDTIETFRDVLSGLLDIHLSSLSNRMNEVMKVLTIIATIFIPITFIAGIYGMNFQSMPELDEPWGYPAALLLMLAVSVGMLYYFRRKEWI
jgi:magnesium transporter